MPDTKANPQQAQDESLRLARYEPIVGQKVRCEGGEFDVELKLEEASALSGHDAETRECFSLLFSFPQDRSLPQGTYAFHLPDGEQVSLFATPVMDPQFRNLRLEVVINRFVAHSGA